ncbi:hypothetical protein SUDANB1_02205 [Streptomyces sp. enrichment culture]
MALVELSVVEQRYRTVLAVLAGSTVTEVAASLGVSRQTVSGWKSRYEAAGLAGLVDRSRRPASCPHQASAEVEAAVCELRRKHPRWGPRRIAHVLEKSGAVDPTPSRMTVYRILVRQAVSLGRPYAGRTITVHVAESTLTVELDGQVRVIQRTTDIPVRHVKANKPHKVSDVV